MNTHVPTGDLSPNEITTSLALEADATPEPWHAVREYDCANQEEFRDVYGPEGEALFGCHETSHSSRMIRNADNDSEYVARVRNEHPRLLAEVQRHRFAAAGRAAFFDEVIAQSMFVAYNAQAGGLTYDGKPIPPWSDVGPKVKANWIAAARRARELLG